MKFLTKAFRNQLKLQQINRKEIQLEINQILISSFRNQFKTYQANRKSFQNQLNSLPNPSENNSIPYQTFLEINLIPYQIL